MSFIRRMTTYLGPFAKVQDDLGNDYTRFKPVAVNNDLATYLQKSSHSDNFVIVAASQSHGHRSALQSDVKRLTPRSGPSNQKAPSCDTHVTLQADDGPCRSAENRFSALDAVGVTSPPALKSELHTSKCCDDSADYESSTSSNNEPMTKGIAVPQAQPATAKACCPNEVETKYADTAYRAADSNTGCR